ncbi:LOB domain-containing protein 41 [Senna tora]|uniref:LOB domain-containing protein 41 n=1 Tax=Senna tora TaxID=362788 RepID=A0A834TF42_9FABA|nr:LOB domain-containing protein 41 [Senna tora]
MRMSCNGCRVLRKGCSENCSIRPCLVWIKSPESQANATVFLAKFYGRAGLMNLINAGPEHLRPAIFRSLLYEACGRIVNPIYGSVGLLWSGSWQLCQAAVEAVLKGAPITPITSEAATTGRGPPLKAYDIRHVSKDENSAASSDPHQRPKTTRSRFKRSGKPKADKGVESVVQPGPAAAAPMINAWAEEVANRSASHESSVSHQSEAANESKESESMISVETAETSVLFRDEPESTGKGSDESGGGGGDVVGLELTLGLEPASRANHVVPMKKRKIEFRDSEKCKKECVISEKRNILPFFWGVVFL